MKPELKFFILNSKDHLGLFALNKSFVLRYIIQFAFEVCDLQICLNCVQHELM